MSWVFYVTLAGFVAFNRRLLDVRGRFLTFGGAVVAFAGVWHFVSFALHLWEWSEEQRVVAAALFSGGVFALLTFLLRRPPSARSTAAAVVGCLVVIGVRLNEGHVENLVGRLVGYYPEPWRLVAAAHTPGAFSFVHPEGYYEVTIPEDWQRRTNEAGYTYFVRQIRGPNGNPVEAKLWLTCGYELAPSVPELIQALRGSVSGLTHRCAAGEDYIACQLDYRTDVRGFDEVVRRFLVTAFDQSRGAEIQVQAPHVVEHVWAETDAIFASLRWLPLPASRPTCVSSIAWF